MDESSLSHTRWDCKAKKGYRKKGKYNNRGKHKGWYKNGKIPTEQQGAKAEIEYYLNDISEPLTQVLMNYGEDGKFNAAYTYGNERIEVEAVDETRPESQDPLYYLYDGLGSVAYMVKPDGIYGTTIVTMSTANHLLAIPSSPQMEATFCTTLLDIQVRCGTKRATCSIYGPGIMNLKPVGS